MDLSNQNFWHFLNYSKKKYLNFNYLNPNLYVQTLSSKQRKEENDGDVEQQMGSDGGKHVDSV